MPADTAYLQGGPCDGQTKKISPAESDSGTIICKNSDYQNANGAQRANGDIIFKYAGKAPAAGGGISAPHAHKGWASLQTSVNKHWHPALQNSQRYTRDTLRKLHKVRRVGG